MKNQRSINFEPESEPRATVELLGEREVDLAPTQEEPKAAKTPVENLPVSSPGYRALLPVFETAARILSARLLLVMALIGSFVLALITILNPTKEKLMTDLVYDLTIFGPLVMLYLRSG